MVFKRVIRKIASVGLSALLVVSAGAEIAAADDAPPAKDLFGAITLPTRGKSAPYGFYAKGCMAGGVAIPTDGPTWQAMRLSRNRRWGQPEMIALIEKLSRDAAKYDGWPGLLLGDISQPRGGPMKTGHASHQIGLDADIWLTPMPQRRLSADERESISARTMLKQNAFLTVDPNVWTPAHARVIMRAASYPEVERIFVNPAIKKKLCETWTGDRSALGKVRPYYGHDYHFHVRIHCPAGDKDCKPQDPVARGDGCDKSLAWWFTKEPWAKPDKKPDTKPVKPRYTKLSDLPKACALVLNAPPVRSEAAATVGGPAAAMTASAPAAVDSATEALPTEAESVDGIDAAVPVPASRPAAP